MLNIFLDIDGIEFSVILRHEAYMPDMSEEF